MGRRRGLAASLAARRQREAARVQVVNTQAARAAERARKAYERARTADAKERKRLYLEAREAEVHARNERLTHEVESLERLLSAALSADAWVDFEALKKPFAVPPFDGGDYAIPLRSRGRGHPELRAWGARADSHGWLGTRCALAVTTRTKSASPSPNRLAPCT